MIELVIPLAVTVVAIQHAQGIAVLQAAGYTPPTNRLTLICGAAFWGLLIGCLMSWMLEPQEFQEMSKTTTPGAVGEGR